jgi:plasmid maintenance system antidote protein VapI
MTGEELTAFREKWGLSKTALAWWLGCTRFHICNMEMGRRRVTAATEEALKQFLGPYGWYVTWLGVERVRKPGRRRGEDWKP